MIPRAVIRVANLPRPPNYPLIYPKYPLLRTIKALLRGTWGVLVGFRVWGVEGSGFRALDSGLRVRGRIEFRADRRLA